ncbi:hypothetical protein V7S43_007797 [Phytophthora oleae]|uniref:P-type ATPase C-terminal domain-containing protein n=1 Tax=Phytophthora oleae TaxID=2107226 RepID=A0ABD3FLV9_9STRA
MESPSPKSHPLQWFARLEEGWNAIQVGRQGSYSVERLKSFDHYLTVVLLECMPLRSPSDGWAANWVFWIHLTLMSFVMVFAGTSQVVTLVPDMNPTFIRRQLVVWLATILYVGGFLVAASSLSVFPIPLQLYIGGFFMRRFFCDHIRSRSASVQQYGLLQIP